MPYVLDCSVTIIDFSFIFNNYKRENSLILENELNALKIGIAYWITSKFFFYEEVLRGGVNYYFGMFFFI